MPCPRSGRVAHRPSYRRRHRASWPGSRHPDLESRWRRSGSRHRAVEKRLGRPARPREPPRCLRCRGRWRSSRPTGARTSRATPPR